MRPRLALVLSATALGIGLALLARAWPLGAPDPPPEYYTDVYRPSEDPKLAIELIPSFNDAINADGFYGPEYSLTAPQHTWRVVGVGDSVSMYYSAEGLNHLSMLERQLPEMIGQDVEILNFGVAGYATAQEVHTLAVRGLKYGPDFVIVTYCVNDNIAIVDLAISLGLEPSLGEFPYYDGYDTFRLVREALRADDAPTMEELFIQEIAPTDHWRHSIGAFQRLAAMSREHGFGVLVVLFPALVDVDDYFLAPIHQELLTAGAKLGVPMLDLAPVFGALGDGREFAVQPVDAVHPTPAGYAVAADAILDWFAQNRPWESDTQPN